MTTTDTHCPYCSPQCGMRLAAPAAGAAAQVLERPEFPVDRGTLCGKGQSAATLLTTR